MWQGTNTVGYNWLDNAFTNVNWESNPEDWGAGQGDGYWLQISGWLPWWQATNGAFFLPAAGWNVAKINANLNSLSNGPPETSYARRWSYSKSQTYRSYVTDITWDGYPSAYELDSPQTQFSEMQANSNSYTVIYSVPAWTLPYWPTQIVCSAVCYAVCQTGLIDSVGSHQWSDGTITNVGSVVITHCGGPSNACADVVSIPDTIPPPTPGEIDTTAMGRSLFGGFGIVGHGVRYEADSRSGSTNEWTGTRYQSGQVLLKWQFQCLTNAP